MHYLQRIIINSREDLDSIKGTPEYEQFMHMLKASMKRKQDVQVYPDGYGMPGYEGEALEPIWEEVEDLSCIERFGLKKEDFEEI